MENLQEQYIVDQQGKRVGVVLDISTYQHLLDQLEELESLYAYDSAIASDDEVIPLEEAIAEIERNRDSP